jgi:hypothetical protein
VIETANGKDREPYMVEIRASLRKLFASLRLALAKISAPEKADLLKKLDRVKPA